MKTIRSLMILEVLSIALFALAAPGAKAQVLGTTNFSGTFTLPAETHWGAIILPAGDYSLYYGRTNPGSSLLIEVAGKAKGSPHVVILPFGRDHLSAANNVLDCVREDDILYVRALEMPDVGESIHFRIPHGVEVRSKLIAQNHNASGKTQLAMVEIPVSTRR